MAIGTGAQRPVFSSGESRRAHRAGSGSAKFARDNGSSLFTAVVPDETGTMGCGLSLTPTASTIAISGTLYAQYLGRATGGKKLDTVSVITTVGATGTVASKVGFCTSDAGPDFTAKTLTVRAVQSLDLVAGTGRRSNLSGLTAGTAAYEAAKLAFSPASGQHIWAFILQVNGSTQATQWGLSGDVGAGALQTLTAQTIALCLVDKVYVTALPTASVTAFQAPQLYVV